MSKKQKLELTWIGKEHRPRLEPRILLEDPEKSHHAAHRVSENDIFDNQLIFGDNLLALKALEQEFTGKVKCIYIDPPYNTGNAFEHYDDGTEHSIWLSMMKARLEILKNLLTRDGVIFISIDDREQAYLKVLLDELFGRNNFCGQFIWEKKRKPSFLSSQMGSVTEYIIAYAKERPMAPPFIWGEKSGDETYPLYNSGNSRSELAFPPKSMFFPKHQDGKYPPCDYSEKTSLVRLKTELEIKDGWNASNFIIEGEWRYGQSSINEQINQNDYYIVKTRKFRPRRVFQSNNENSKKKLHNLLSRAHYEMPTYEDSASESIALFGNDGAFDYPKPEKLIYTLLNAVTEPNDLVLDSFAGSGTTGAVAHKMGRRWIMVELGEHCHTHIIPRMQKVIDGTDQGGISKALDWKGGGGFRYYRIAPSLLEKDAWGNWVISHDYKPEMLAEAMCKHMASAYAPSEAHYWMHGHSSETDFIYVTTASLTHDQLRAISEEVGEERTLMICCKAFKANTDRFENLTVIKIPRAVLKKCEWGRDDYSLNVENLQPVPAEEPTEEPAQAEDPQLLLPIGEGA